mmetsp:Transcript_11729/g.31234  ORF Transcript_11729/g.31234 Transcript_11729/m.31234 type:complete len:260 (-) Transcript_11729:88-867(-)
MRSRSTAGGRCTVTRMASRVAASRTSRTSCPGCARWWPRSCSSTGAPSRLAHCSLSSATSPPPRSAPSCAPAPTAPRCRRPRRSRSTRSSPSSRRVTRRRRPSVSTTLRSSSSARDPSTPAARRFGVCGRLEPGGPWATVPGRACAIQADRRQPSLPRGGKRKCGKPGVVVAARGFGGELRAANRDCTNRRGGKRAGDVWTGRVWRQLGVRGPKAKPRTPARSARRRHARRPEPPCIPARSSVRRRRDTANGRPRVEAR